MKIMDSVVGIVYRNDENGYSVLKLEGGTTAVGVFPQVAEGQEFQFEGEYVQNAKFGKQFKVTNYTAHEPNTPDRIRQFIGSGLISGIGPATAERIVKTFGLDTLAIMEFRPDELKAVKGISEKKAVQIGERYAEVKEMQKSVAFLQQYEISLNLAIRIFNQYKAATIERVRQNPYQLIEAIDGVGFLTADKLAKSLGVAYSGRFRVRAGVVYVLKTAAETDGHTCLPTERLFALVMRLLLIKADNLRPIFDEVLFDLCVDKYLSRAGDRVALTKYYNAEKNIAAKLRFLIEHSWANDRPSLKGQRGAGELLDHYQQIHKIKLHEKQRLAVESAVQNGVTVITGGPGTGKTTIIRAILFINNARHEKTQLLAPTGRAAKRLEETCGIQASTIHRALDIDYKGGKGVFTYDDPENYLRADVVIVDEISMCDAVLMNQLLAKVMAGTRIVLVGDIDQLASVGAGAVLSDIIASDVVPTVRLTEIYRQDAMSKIVESAHAINRGEMPDLSNKSNDFFFEAATSPGEIKRKVISLVTTRLPGYLASRLTAANGAPRVANVQVLCPMKLGEAGMTALNSALQAALNPPRDGAAEYLYGETIYREGDRVMQTLNNYQQEWTRADSGEAGEGVFNGDLGRVTAVNPQNGEVRVTFEDGRETVYVRSDLTALTPSYAITVHKSQGCEFDAVVIPITSGAYMILTRNLLYTAVTRARNLVMLVGDPVNIEKMVSNTYTKQRFTLLQHFLKPGSAEGTADLNQPEGEVKLSTGEV
jgi:exodeoxyribonuclease V alpha subunit